jgi:nucleoside diphosphate kinase
MLKLTEENVSFIYSEHVGRPYFQHIVRHMISDAVVGIEVAGNSVQSSMLTIAGPTNP